MTLYEKRPRFLEFGEMIIKIESVVNGKIRGDRGRFQCHLDKIKPKIFLQGKCSIMLHFHKYRKNLYIFSEGTG